MRISAHIDHAIHVRKAELPEEMAELLTGALTIPNLEKLTALKNHEWGAESLPDEVELFQDDGTWLTIPRGFKNTFEGGLQDLGILVQWCDHRAFKSLLRIGTPVRLREWQGPAMQRIIEAEYGIYKAPAGSGKTVTVLATIQRLGCKSLIIVNTKDILWQWQARVRQFLGESYPIGQVGDNTFDVSPYITIATAQTINSRFDQLWQAASSQSSVSCA